MGMVDYAASHPNVRYGSTAPAKPATPAVRYHQTMTRAGYAPIPQPQTPNTNVLAWLQQGVANLQNTTRQSMQNLNQTYRQPGTANQAGMGDLQRYNAQQPNAPAFNPTIVPASSLPQPIQQAGQAANNLISSVLPRQANQQNTMANVRNVGGGQNYPSAYPTGIADWRRSEGMTGKQITENQFYANERLHYGWTDAAGVYHPGTESSRMATLMQTNPQAQPAPDMNTGGGYGGGYGDWGYSPYPWQDWGSSQAVPNWYLNMVTWTGLNQG